MRLSESEALRTYSKMLSSPFKNGGIVTERLFNIMSLTAAHDPQYRTHYWQCYRGHYSEAALNYWFGLVRSFYALC